MLGACANKMPLPKGVFPSYPHASAGIMDASPPPHPQNLANMGWLIFLGRFHGMGVRQQPRPDVGSTIPLEWVQEKQIGGVLSSS